MMVPGVLVERVLEEWGGTAWNDRTKHMEAQGRSEVADGRGAGERRDMGHAIQIKAECKHEFISHHGIIIITANVSLSAKSLELKSVICMTTCLNMNHTRTSLVVAGALGPSIEPYIT